MVFLIAEIGINHNGDMNIAKKLIDAAKDADFDAVKFQKRTINKVYTKEFLDSPRQSPWGTTQREQKEGLEFNENQYKEIDKYCKSIGIEWTASAWDVESQEFVNSYKPSFNKIASPMNTNLELIKKACELGSKLYISTGMSTKREIDAAVDLVKSKNVDYELMHCNSSYPMNECNANLSRIGTLKKVYNCDVGYSGHETTLNRVCIAAVVLGATSIERHITLDRAMYGSDQSASVGAHSLRSLVSGIRAAESFYGYGSIENLQEGEKEAYKKLKYKSNI